MSDEINKVVPGAADKAAELVELLVERLEALRSVVADVDTEKAWELYSEIDERIDRLIDTINHDEELGTRTLEDAYELLQIKAHKLRDLLNAARQARGKKAEPDYLPWLRANPAWLEKSGTQIAQKLARLGFEPRTPQAINAAKKKIKTESETP